MIIRELVAKFGYSFDTQDADKFDARVKASKSAAEKAIESARKEAEAGKEAAEAEGRARLKAASEKVKAAKEALAATEKAVAAEIRALKKTEGETEASFRERAKAAKEAARERIQAARDAAKHEVEAAHQVKSAVAEETRLAVSGYRKKVEAARDAAKDRVDAELLVVEAERKADEKRTAALSKGRERIKGFMEGVATLTKRVVQVGAAASVALAAGAAHSLAEKEDRIVGLETQTGSRAAATREYERLKKFGRASGVGGDNAVDAFTRLKGLNVRSDDRAIESFGNIGAGTKGKSTNDVIEAVADAATFEFERLKEFGIKASQQGDQVSLTFKGVTTTINKDAAAVTEYLVAIGETDFAGAVGRRSKTLGGTFEKLKESAVNFLLTVGESGLGKVLGDIAKKLDVTTAGGKALATQLGEFLARSARSLFDIFMSALPLLTKLIELLMGIINVLGGPAGLVALLVAGKVAMMSMNLAMTSMTIGGGKAAGALGSIAKAGGLVSAAIAAAALIVGHFEEKIASLREESEKGIAFTDEAFARQVKESENSDLEYLKRGQEETLRHAKNRLAENEKRQGDVRYATHGGENSKLATMIKADEAIIKSSQDKLDQIKAEEDARLQSSVGRSATGSARGVAAALAEGNDGFGAGPAGATYGAGIPSGMISAKEVKARKVKDRLKREQAKYGATDVARADAQAKYDKAIAAGDTPAKAMSIAVKDIQTSANYTKPKAGKKRKKKTGEVDKEAFAEFEADVRKRAVEYGATEAGIQESLAKFRSTMEYDGGNAAAAKKAGIDVLRNDSGLTGKDGLTITDLLDRDFGAGKGMPGGSPDGRGGGGLGTTINRIDQTFAPKIDVKIDVMQLEGESGGDFAERVRDQVIEQVNQAFNDGYDHFKAGS